MVSGLPLSTFKHLERRWLSQAGCLCSCCALWGQTDTRGGQIISWHLSHSSTWDTQLSTVFSRLYRECSQCTCARKHINFANTMLISFCSPGWHDVQSQGGCGSVVGMACSTQPSQTFICQHEPTQSQPEPHRFNKKKKVNIFDM